MAKKRRRKSSTGGFAGIGAAIQKGFKLLTKSVPLVFVILAVGAAFLGIRSALYADSNLWVQKITVQPPQALSLQERERLDAQILGKNILKTDLKKIAAGLEKDPFIQSAQVVRRLPSEILIQVEKRQPIAFIRFGTDQDYGVVSADGMILDVVDVKAASGIIVEAPDLGNQNVSVGQHVKNRGFNEAVQFLAAYQQQPLAAREPVTRILLDHLGNVSVVLKEGPEVRLGHRPSRRVDAFKKIIPLLETEMRKKIDYIDLQYDDVVVKQKRGGK